MDFTYKHLYILVYVFASSCSAMPIYSGRYGLQFIDKPIVYKVNPNLNVDPEFPVEKYIEDAIHEYETHSCIRFQKWNNDANFIEFRWSENERTSKQGQPFTDNDGNERYLIWINIGPELLKKQDTNNHNRGRMLFWISKAIGFYNEHQRPDRDLFIRVNMDNVHWNLYGTYIDDQAIDPIVPYDYLSITHLPSIGFPAPNKAILTHDPSYEELIGNYNHLSFFDIMAVNKVLECDVKECTGDNPCPPLSYRGEDCKCHCSAVSLKLANADYQPNMNWERRVELAISTSVNQPTEACSPPTLEKSQCPDGWLYMGQNVQSSNDFCYREFHESLTWDEAERRCIELGARLASPTQWFHNMFMAEAIMSYGFAWLNVKYEHYTKYEAWVTQDTGTIIGSDMNLDARWLWAWHNFDDPESLSTGDTCIAIDRTGKWVEKSCSVRAPTLVCQKRLQCPMYWFYKGDHCYKPITHVNTWEHQIDECKRYQANLATSMSREENWFLTQMLAPVKSTWIGAKKETPNSHWKWEATQKRFDLNTWTPFWRKDWRTPTANSDVGHCMMLDRDGWWVDTTCNTAASGICKKRVARPPGQHTFVGCENSKVDIRCEPWGLINLKKVVYGRMESKTCPDAIDSMYQTCEAPHAYSGLYLYCQSRRECISDIVVNIALNHNVDPCPGISKYLYVEYDCKQEFVENEECPHLTSLRVGPKDWGYFDRQFYMERSDVDAEWELKRCGSDEFYYPAECGCSVGGDFAAIATHVTAPRMPTLLLVSLSATLVCSMV